MLISNIFVAAFTFFLMLVWLTNLIDEYTASNVTSFNVDVVLSYATFIKTIVIISLISTNKKTLFIRFNYFIIVFFKTHLINSS